MKARCAPNERVGCLAAFEIPVLAKSDTAIIITHGMSEEGCADFKPPILLRCLPGKGGLVAVNVSHSNISCLDSDQPLSDCVVVDICQRTFVASGMAE